MISLRESGIFSFLQRNDIYDEDRLRADEEALRRFYFNRGYADFRIVSSVAELDAAKNQYFITITVDEGERYAYGNINIDSTVPGIDGETLRGELKTKTGDVYSAEQIEESLVSLTNAVANRGYAFAQVTPRGDRDFANNTISIDYVIDQGRAPMSSASRFAATRRPATTSSAASSTCRKATPSIRFSCSAPRSASKACASSRP